jgi:8-hydroxy-5-deazaflavin:NADPH oxidoreductase
MKTTVAILGSARPEGKALAYSLANAGFPLRLMCSQHDDLVALTAELNKTYPNADIEYRLHEHETTWEADVIIPAAPFVLFNTITDVIRNVIMNKVLVVIPDAMYVHQAVVKHSDQEVEESLRRSLPLTKVVNAAAPDTGLSAIRDEQMKADVRQIVSKIDLSAIRAA